jgi:protein involved in polysaccharide export with SLBB domain
VALVGLLLGCGAGATSIEVPAAESEDNTTLGAGDVFEVRVYGDADLSSRYRIAPDGTIDVPLIGRLTVRGLEPSQVDDLITTRLRDGHFLVNPQVSVFVEEYNSRRVSVLGAVQGSGTFPITPGMTVVEAISSAGGFTALANRNGTILTRREGSRLRRIPVPVDAIMDGQIPDVAVRAGDIIRVPERIF